MNHSPLSDSPAAERRKTGEAKWTPPAHLLELASYDDGFIADIIDVFKTGTETHLQEMRTAFSTGDIPRLHSLAHLMKGSAMQVGADALAEVCQALELASSLAPALRLAELVDRIQELFAETGGAMTSYSNGNKAGNHSEPLLS